MNQSTLRRIGLIASVLLIVAAAIGFFVWDDRLFSYLYFAVGFVYLIFNLFFNKAKEQGQ